MRSTTRRWRANRAGSIVGRSMIRHDRETRSLSDSDDAGAGAGAGGPACHGAADSGELDRAGAGVCGGAASGTGIAGDGPVDEPVWDRTGIARTSGSALGVVRGEASAAGVPGTVTVSVSSAAVIGV